MTQVEEKKPARRGASKMKAVSGNPNKDLAAPLCDYQEEFASLVVDAMARGLSLTAFAGEIGTSRKSVDAWIEENPGFATAVEKGHAKRVLFFEERLLESAGTQANAQLSILKQAFLQDWASISPKDEEPSASIERDAPISVQRVMVSMEASTKTGDTNEPVDAGISTVKGTAENSGAAHED